MKKLMTTIGAVMMALLATTAHANPLPDKDLKGVYAAHARTTQGVRELIKGFFEDMIKKGYKIEYSIDPVKNEATFTGEYYSFFTGTIKLSGKVTWDEKGVFVVVEASKYQGKVEDKIREFLQEALKK